MTGVYIAGPMRGIDGFNFAAFERADEVVRRERCTFTGDFDDSKPDFEVFNPAYADIVRHGLNTKAAYGGWVAAGRWLEDHPDFDLRKALAEDTQFISLKADHIVLLPGWENSAGVKAEKALSEALGHSVWYLHPDREEIVAYDPALVAPGPTVAEVLRGYAGLLDETVTHMGIGNTQTGEVMSVSTTGAMKGTKPEAHHLIPREGLDAVARHYGKTAKKYPPHNWRNGFEWSKSYDALVRHATAWWSGEDNDPELDSPHLAAVAWHALTLLTFAESHPEFDDRYDPRPEFD